MMHQHKTNTHLDDVIAKASELSEITDEDALLFSKYSEDHLDALCTSAAKIRNYGKYLWEI